MGNQISSLFSSSKTTSKTDEIQTEKLKLEAEAAKVEVAVKVEKNNMICSDLFRQMLSERMVEDKMNDGGDNVVNDNTGGKICPENKMNDGGDNVENGNTGGNVCPEIEEEVCSQRPSLHDIGISVSANSTDIAEYCIPLLSFKFHGETNSAIHSDETDTKDILHLGLYLKLIDKFLRQFDNVEDFRGDEEDFVRLLKLISSKRKRENETKKQCALRLLADAKIFVKVYHKRGEKSEKIGHKEYWGSRQQLLSAKVIADWVDPESGPIDPIFGALLQPTAGRVGPGDSNWVHNILFDNSGYMAYHSAVHDAFGYLTTKHEIGPGYDYMQQSRLNKKQPLAGQISGIGFWKRVIKGIEDKNIVFETEHI